MKLKILFVLLFFYGFAFSQSEVYYFKDSTSNLTYEFVKTQNFKPLKKQILEKHSKDIYWFKIPVHKTDSIYIFKILYERIQKANAYQGSNKLEQLKNKRYLSYQFTRDKDVYIKVNPRLHSYIPVEVLSKDKSILKNNKQLLINGFYYGFAFLVIIYNLSYFLLFRDNAFLYYSLFLASMTFGVFVMDGMLNFYNISLETNTFLMILNYIFLAYFSSKFANSYLFLDLFFPKVKKISYFIGGIIIITGLLYLSFKNFYLLLFINILVFFLLLVYWLSGVLLYRKNVYTKILVFAYIIILFSGIDYYILKFLGISMININPTTIKIGAFLEMIVLSVAVLYRLKTLQNENRFMRDEILNYAKKITFLTSTKNHNDKTNLEELSHRERQIFNLISLSKTNKEIAEELNISVNTVKFHVKNIYEKLNIKSRKEVLISK